MPQTTHPDLILYNLETMYIIAEYTGKIATLEICGITLHLLALSLWKSHFNITEY